MVHFPRAAKPPVRANRSYEDPRPASERVRVDLYNRYHKNTIQRDLLDQGYYVASDTGKPVRPYYRTEGSWDPAVLPNPTADPAQLRADMAKWGYCMVKDALSPEQLGAMRTRLDEQAAGEAAAGLAGRWPETVFLNGLCNKGECFRDAVECNERGVQAARTIERLIDEILGPGWLLNSMAAGIAGKNGIPQALHCGQSMVPKPWPPWPYECFIGFLLDDFSAANGGTLLVPGSHRITTEAGEGPLPPLPPTHNVTAPAGTCVLMEGRVVHGTGVNTTDRPRRLIIMTAHRAFMRTQDTYGVSLDKKVYDAASPKLLARLGFAVEANTGFNGVEGRLLPGTVAPLRDGYLPVGELDASSGAGARGTPFSVRRRARTLNSVRRAAAAKL